MAKDADVLADAKDDGNKDDIVSDGLEAFQRIEEAEHDNRLGYNDDVIFAKLGKQWPEKIAQQRALDGRPCLTSNMLPAFIRQVVNEARKKRPSIKVHPVDSAADVTIANIYSGLIRNIEQTSKADVAYDWGVDCAVSGGFGYWRVDTEYNCDDSFYLDILINRILDPLSVYGDPLSVSSDSSDWNECFVTEILGKAAFRAKYKGAKPVNWEDTGYSKLNAPWFSDNTVQVAEWWKREKVNKKILKLSDDSIIDADVYAKQKDTFGPDIEVLGERVTKSYKVTQYVMTGAEVLETNKWAGKYIPIVPIYGDEVYAEGKRHFRSLIRDAKDEQRMRNYFRTASTEMTALAPKVPFIGKKGTFKTDARKWATINSANHAYVEYDGEVEPKRQPLDSGRAIGAIQETLNATDGMKAIMGLYNASLGAQGNEVSGKAILARQQEGDDSNFHFIDNESRAIEHTGRVVIDLIPKVYTPGRIIRTLGANNKAQSVSLGQPIQVMGANNQPQIDPATQLPMTKICDLSVGRYDLTVETGPSYATKREQVADQVLQLIDAYPPSAPVLGDILVKNLDLPEPDSDEIQQRLQALLPPQLQPGGGQQQDPMQHPQVQAVMQQGQQVIQQQGQQLQQATQQAGQLQQQLQLAEQALAQAKAANDLKSRELDIKGYEAETARIQAQKPEPLRAV